MGKKPTYRTSALVLIFIFLNPSLKSVAQETGRDTTGFKGLKGIRVLAKENSKAAKSWWYAWITGYSLATVAQVGVAESTTSLSLKQDMWNGAVTTFLGVAGCLVTPLVPGEAEVRKKLEREKSQGIITDNDIYAEALHEMAVREKFGRSWKVHAVTGIVNMGSGLVTWLGFKRKFSDGLVTFAINTVVTEAQIWSQPIRAVKDYERYKTSKNLAGLNKAPGPVKTIAVSAAPGGASLRIIF